MGLGKTVSTLTAVEFLIYHDFAVNTVLVVAPKRVVENVWTTEGKKWEHLNKLRITRIIGTPKQRKAALKEEADVYLISKDNLVWLIALHGSSRLPFDMLVIDESSAFKNHASKRFKALKLVIGCFDRVVILTGTPAPNGLKDLWAQIYLLDRGKRLGKNITAYRREFFYQGHNFYQHYLRGGSEKAIHEKIADICISMKAEDYLDLPKRVDNYIELVLPKKIKKQYDEFEEEQVLELFDSEDVDEISVVNAAALSNKLMQFSNGAVYDEDKNWHSVHNVKLDAAEELVENAAGNPVLIFYTFKHDLEKLQQRLSKYSPVKLKTNKDIEDWNAGKIQVMLMHPASGGHGLNLQYGGHIMIWYGPTWNLEHLLQAIKRLDRQGQTKPVIVNYLICKNTIDERVVKATDKKEEGQKGLMAAIKATVKKYRK